VKRVGQFQQTFADEKKEKTGNHHSEGALREPENGGESEALRKRPARQFLQTGGANNAVFVFGDTFTAEESLAFRAARDGFAHGMVETALMRKSLHRGFRRELAARRKFQPLAIALLRPESVGWIRAFARKLLRR
jgi:hypothetical protein